MAPLQERAVVSLLPPSGSLDSATTPFFSEEGATALKLSRTLIIVIAISVLVGCIIILVLLFRCFHRPKSAPLPPIQPLAHCRGKERKHLPYHKGRGFDCYGTNASSLKPSRMSSFRTYKSSSTLSSSRRSPFIHPPPSTNGTSLPSSLSAESNSDEQTYVTQKHVPMTYLACSVSLPSKNSTVSTRNTSTHTSVNTICGPPHSSYSEIQIVLPTPLAPQLQNHMIANLLPIQTCGESAERGDITDRWMMALIRTTSRRSNSDQNPLVEDAPSQRKTRLNSGHRRSLDVIDERRGSEARTQSRGRTPPHRLTRPQSPSQGDTTPSPYPPDDQTSIPRVTSENRRDGQGTFTIASLRWIPLIHFIPQLHNHPLNRWSNFQGVRRPIRTLVLGNTHPLVTHKICRSLNPHHIHTIIIPTRLTSYHHQCLNYHSYPRGTFASVTDVISPFQFHH